MTIQSVTNMYEHSTEVTDENKCIQKMYLIPIHYQKQLEHEIKSMVDNNIIEQSNSNFLTPMILVKKKKITSEYV